MLRQFTWALLTIAVAGYPAAAQTQIGSVLVSHDFNQAAQDWQVARDTGTVDAMFTASGSVLGGTRFYNRA